MGYCENKSSIKKTGVLIVFFVIGGVVGLFTSSYLYNKYVFSKSVTRDIEDVGWQLLMVSKLRLGETNDVINILETAIDDKTLNIKLSEQNKNIIPYNMLRKIKTYREIYPSNSKNASQLANVLKEIPKLEVFECNGPLCRLVTQTRKPKK